MAIDIRHLRRISLHTTEFEESVDYYGGPWGLEIVDQSPTSACLRATGPEHHCLELHASGYNGIEHIGFGLPSMAAVEEAADEIDGQGIQLLSTPADLAGPGGGYGFRLADPEGRVIELSTMVEAVAPRSAGSSPTTLSHVVLNTVDIDAAYQWWCGVLGFRVSDWSEHQMVFLRCNTNHHSIAFNQAEWTAVNHIAYEVASLGAFMISLGRLRHDDHTPGWGPGRHGPGHNAFAYFVDPSGLVPEVTTDLEQVDESLWVPRVWRRIPELSDLWGTAGAPSPDIRGYMAGTPDPTADRR